MFAGLKKALTPTAPEVGDVWSLQAREQDRIRILRIQDHTAMVQSLSTGHCLNLPVDTVKFMYRKEQK